MLKRTFSIVSLGCFRNTYDSEVIAKRFDDQGYTFLPNQSIFEDKKKNKKICDLLVLNTCGFIDRAKEESIDTIKTIVKLKKEGRVRNLIVVGCLVKRYSKTLKKFFPEIDQWHSVENFSKTFSSRLKIGNSSIDFLKICEGCFNKCSFCAIPSIKGTLVSKSLSVVLNEVKYLDKKGIKELNLIGQDITSWGKDLGGRNDLVFLVKKILKETKNIKWIRLIYTHPRHFSDSLIKLIAEEERICKYIDLPIQHINDRILRAMNRKINKKDIIKLIVKIRKKIPDCVLRTSVIVGFPTETEDEFKELLNFLKEVKFERLGTFIYSKEEGTRAYSMPSQVHPRTKRRRYRQVMALQKEIAASSNNRFVDKEMDVLIENKEQGAFIGRTQYDAPEVDGVVFVNRKRLKLGEFYKVKIIDSWEYDLIAN